MFAANSFDKNCVKMSENSSPGRSCNNNSRFPLGISSSGDESQNMRIQLAVHKYNNAPNSLTIKKRNLISPIRHSFLKNSCKSKSYESEADLASKHERKSEMQYEGVGNFPTVHLRKRAVLFRPIRKFKEAKVLHPELPVNRFLNQVPELCSDLNSSTRSVLDVLQDMSTKKIHSKDVRDCTKFASKGLGGDLPADEKSLSRPLFVQKPKEKGVLTRDRTTQTLTPENLNLSTLVPNISITKPDASDPRAELRKKLAKKNNEISASLSSSISSTFPTKRKIDNISATKEDRSKSDTSIVKKPKILDNYSVSDKGNVSVVNGIKSNTNKLSTKTSKINKLNEENTISPNKDRLTRIFLDIDKTSSKNQIFQNSVKNSESDSCLSKSNSLIESNDFIKENGNTVDNGLVESRNAFSSSKNSSFNLPEANSFSLSESLGKKSELQTSNLANQTSSSISVNNNLNSNESSSSTSPFKFDSSNRINFNSNDSQGKSMSTANNLLTTASSTTISAKVTQNSGSNEKATSENTETDKFSKTCKNNSTSESGEKNGESNNFRFGSGVELSTKKTDSLTPELSTSNTTTISNASATTQFSFGLNSGLANSKSAGLPEPTKNLSGQSTVSSDGVVNVTAKSAFTLEQTRGTSQEETNSISGKSEGISKNEFSVNTNSNLLPASSSATNLNFNNGINSTTTSIFGKSSPSSAFTFGQKSSGPVETSSSSSSNGKTVADSKQNGSQQGFTIQWNADGEKDATNSLKLGFEIPFGSSPSTTVANKSENSTLSAVSQSSPFVFNPVVTTTSVKSTSLFSNSLNVTSALGQKESPMVSDTSSGNVSNQSKPQTTLNFVFGQKSDGQNSSLNNEIPKENSSGQDGQTKTFTFGQTSSGQLQSNPSSATQSTGFGQNLLNLQSNTTNISSIFGQNNSQASTASQNSQLLTSEQNQTVGKMPAMGFESKTGNLATFSATPLFGSNAASFSTSLNKFGTTTTQSDTKFGDSAFQATPKFEFSATTQSTPAFGAPQTTQASVSFGTPGFSTTNTASAGSTFGDSTGTQRTLFGNPMSPLSQTFGENKQTPTTQSGALASGNIFGQSMSASSSTPVGGFNSTVNSGFNVPTGQNIFGSSSNQDGIFGKPTKIQTAAFGNNPSPAQSLATPNKFVFGASTSGGTTFATSSPKATATTGFTLNPAATPSSAGTFGSSSASAGFNSASTPQFSFNSQPNNNFMFKPAAGGEGSGFENPNPSTINFGGQMNNNNNNSNNNNNLEAKPANAVFHFGSSQSSSGSTGFNFGSTPSPSVFSFGGSGSGSGSSTFSFGTPKPGGPLGQANSSPASSTISAPGFFSIGSGSSQSRPKASARLRRRP